MQVSRIDLADKGSPEGLVALLLKHEPNLAVPIPIEELCFQLDIEEIIRFDEEGFEGGLITDNARSKGIVLVNRRAIAVRQRFTIAHELGHFLMPSHIPNFEGKFLCSSKDLKLLDAKESDRRAKMEVEANRFAALILIPPPILRPRLGDPSIENVFSLASDFKVSKEAMCHAYADFHSEAVAFVVVKDRLIRRIYRNRKRFPFIVPQVGQRVPDRSVFHRSSLQRSIPSSIESCIPDLWIDVERGANAPVLCEQVCLQANDCALIMLWHEHVEQENDEDEDRTSKQRLLDRQSKWSQR